MTNSLYINLINLLFINILRNIFNIEYLRPQMMMKAHRYEARKPGNTATGVLPDK
jgi:hypothetical protein